MYGGTGAKHWPCLQLASQPVQVLVLPQLDSSAKGGESGSTTAEPHAGCPAPKEQEGGTPGTSLPLQQYLLGTSQLDQGGMGGVCVCVLRDVSEQLLQQV